MSLYRQPGSANWWITVQVAGTRIRRSTGTADRREAEEFEQRERERLWRTEKLGDRGATAFAEVAARWLLETEKRTLEKDRLILDWFCAQPELKERAIADIDSESLQVLRQLIADEGRAPGTVNRYMACLRAVLRKAVEWGYLSAAPNVPMSRATPAEPRWLTRREFERLKRELPPHLKLAGEFAVLTGLRMRSMLALTWDRIDLKTRRAWVPGIDMKAGKAIGLPLSTQAIAVLERCAPKRKRQGHVFRYEGAPIDDCNTAAFQKAVKRAKLGPLRWHDLRHTFAAWAVQNGVTLHELMQLGGWASYQMVLRYAHLAPDHLARAAQKVAGKSHRRRKRAA